MLCLAITAASLAGCSSARYDAAVVGNETFTTNSPQVVLDAPPVVAHRVAKPSTAANPWWMTRNDDRLNVRSGSNQARTGYVRYDIYDHQGGTDQAVYDHYRRRARSVVIDPILP